MMFSDFQDQEVCSYFEEKVNPVFSQLITTLVKNRPENIQNYISKWFTQLNKKQIDDHDPDEYVPEEKFNAWKKQRIEKGLRKNRNGIAAEIFRQSNKRPSIKLPKSIEISEQTQMKIMFSCTNSFLFRNLNQQEIKKLVTMTKKVNVVKDDIIISQQGPHDSIYFIDQGIFQLSTINQKKKKTIKHFYAGQTFGQIFLLHSLKEYGVITAISDGVLYQLDRETYKHYKKISVVKKRKLYAQTLKKQSFFNYFNEEELQKICDLLSEITYDQGQYIINEGDYGTNFYIIIEGILVAFKGKQSNVIQCYKEGDAFGEIALIKDLPRQASVKSLTKCKLVYLTQEIFKRVFAKVNFEKDFQERYAKRGNCINIKRKE